jgi:hypothetical protein
VHGYIGTGMDEWRETMGVIGRYLIGRTIDWGFIYLFIFISAFRLLAPWQNKWNLVLFPQIWFACWGSPFLIKGALIKQKRMTNEKRYK